MFPCILFSLGQQQISIPFCSFPRTSQENKKERGKKIIYFLLLLISCTLGAVLSFPFRPVSKNILHRRTNKIVAELLWLQLIGLVDE
jgi:hypothetical protein